MRRYDFSSVVICEDIRREITDKLILIGVYTGDVTVPSFPISIQFAIYVEIRNVPAGQHTLEFQVGLRGKHGMGGQVHIDNKADGLVGFVIPAMQLLIEENSEFVLSFKNGDEFEELRNKKILLGATVEPFNVSSVLPRP